MLAATLCQENPERNHKLSNFGSIEREKIKWLKEGINGWDVLFIKTINHLVEKEGTYGWNVLFVNNKSSG